MKVDLKTGRRKETELNKYKENYCYWTGDEFLKGAYGTCKNCLISRNSRLSLGSQLHSSELT